jgi:hypothetical protein
MRRLFALDWDRDALAEEALQGLTTLRSDALSGLVSDEICQILGTQSYLAHFLLELRTALRDRGAAPREQLQVWKRRVRPGSNTLSFCPRMPPR